MKTSEVLRNALSLISTPKTWHQGDNYRRDEDGDITGYCMSGAILSIAGEGTEEYNKASNILIEAGNPGTTVSFRNSMRFIGWISNFNDDSLRTHNEILDLMGKAVNLAEEKENEQ